MVVGEWESIERGRDPWERASMGRIAWEAAQSSCVGAGRQQLGAAISGGAGFNPRGAGQVST